MDIMVAQRIIFSLGLVNAVTASLLLFTCRCVPGLKLGGRLMKYQWFKRFYKYHCYLWWVFWPSVIVHAILAISFLGIPF